MKYLPFGRTGLRVSQVALGTGNFGTGWGYGADPEAATAVFNAYAEAGGNFIDSADVYQFGQSEELLGKLLEGRRENFVVATKFTNGAVPNADRLVTGNSRKAMVASVEASLRRLKTDRIDLYWVHHPDGVTPTEELVRGFDDLARAGKILYAGLSNFAAWRLTRAVTLAELARSVPIAGAQFEHSLVHREPEAELFPATRALGLGVVTWSPAFPMHWPLLPITSSDPVGAPASPGAWKSASRPISMPHSQAAPSANRWPTGARWASPWPMASRCR